MYSLGMAATRHKLLLLVHEADRSVRERLADYFPRRDQYTNRIGKRFFFCQPQREGHRIMLLAMASRNKGIYE